MKLPQVSGREVIKRLSKIGFVAIRQKGSHIVLEKIHDQKIKKVTVPLHKELKKGTLSRILKDAGVSPKKFMKK